MWNLNFFRYVIPPFCISPRFQIIVYLQSISTLFPFVLIAITWICIEMHSRNCKILVCMWRTLSWCPLKSMNVKQIPNRAVIGTFATFLLLSYAKLIFMLVYLSFQLLYTISVILHLQPLLIHQPWIQVKSCLKISYYSCHDLFWITVCDCHSPTSFTVSSLPH